MSRTYYHPMLDRTFQVKNVKRTKRYVRFEIVNPPTGVQAKRSMTLLQAQQIGLVR